jgi:hypothetical protein
MAGHAGGARMRARIAKVPAGQPAVCSCPLCTRKSAILASPDGLGTQASTLVSAGHSVASTNRHRIPAGWNPDAGGWQTAGASAVSLNDPWYFSAVREPAGPAGSPSDQAVGEQQDRHPGDGGVPGG